MQFSTNFFKSLVQACPYSIVGKKCISVFKNKPSTVKDLKNKRLLFKTGIKTGRNISLIGLFCPFLWYSILTGASKNFIVMNVVHSAIIVGVGLVILGVNYVGLYAYTKSTKKA